MYGPDASDVHPPPPPHPPHPHPTHTNGKGETHPKKVLLTRNGFDQHPNKTVSSPEMVPKTGAGRPSRNPLWSANPFLDVFPFARGVGGGGVG
jgi:hypothetical protein